MSYFCTYLGPGSNWEESEKEEASAENADLSRWYQSVVAAFRFGVGLSFGAAMRSIMACEALQVPSQCHCLIELKSRCYCK